MSCLKYLRKGKIPEAEASVLHAFLISQNK